MKYNQTNVIDVKRLNKGKEKIKTPLLKLTFGQNKIPESVSLGYLHYFVKQYYPPPLRCYQCYRYGHTQKTCRNTITCPKCSEYHDQEDCTSERTKCVNCHQEHTAFDKACEIYKMETRIVETKTNKNITYREARNEIQRSTYSNVLKTGTRQSLTDNDQKTKIITTIKTTITAMINELIQDPNLNKNESLLKLLSRLNYNKRNNSVIEETLINLNG